MAEISIEQKQRNLMPWVIGLALAALLVIGLTLVFADAAAGVPGDDAGEVGKAHEKKPEKKDGTPKDETPRRLQQWADHLPDTPPVRAA